METNFPLVAYYSYTHKTENFINRLKQNKGIRTANIEKDDISEPYVLITPTYSFGEIPSPVQDFLNKHNNNLIAVMSSGNRNWGDNFAKAGELISKQYKVDLIGKFEMYGNEKDIDILINYLKEVG